MSVLSSQKRRELELKYFGKLIESNNVICLQEVHGKDEFLQAISGVGSAIQNFRHFHPW